METLLKISGVDKSFPGVKALNNACLSVYAGRVMALMGKMGRVNRLWWRCLLVFILKMQAQLSILIDQLISWASQEAGISIIHPRTEFGR